MKRNLFIWGVRICMLCIIMFSLYYTSNNWHNKDFYNSFWSNWLATAFGILIGVPIAVELNRIQKNAEVKFKESDIKRESDKKTLKVLSLLKIEIEENLKKLRVYSTDENGIQKRVVQLPSLKNHLWLAFSDSGELQWIQDFDLLNKISNCYFSTSQVIFLEAKYFENVHFPGMRTSRPEVQILEYLNNLNDFFCISMEEAVDLISNKLLTIQKA